VGECSFLKSLLNPSISDFFCKAIAMNQERSVDNTVQATADGYNLPPGCILGTGEYLPFKFSSLWGPAVLNPLNHKSCTLPVLNLRTSYARNFHLFVSLASSFSHLSSSWGVSAWLGFMVAL
jgi:hypothetical protein